MKCDFHRNAWSTDHLTEACSFRFPPMPGFAQRDDCIENIPTSASPDGYAYVSLVTAEKLQPNVTLTIHCAFEKDAAPLIVLSKDLIEKDGHRFYGDYLEVVIWKNGINVWELWQEKPGSVVYHNLLRLEQPIQAGIIHELSVEIQKESFVITLDGSRVALRCSAIYDSFHLGITGCEGPCKFYDMEITQH